MARLLLPIIFAMNRFQGSLLATLMGLLLAQAAPGQSNSLPRYDMGSPVLTNLWVDPVSGNDANTGATSNTALRTIAEAWTRIPMNVALTNRGYHIRLMPGDYPAAGIPGWWASRHGTFACPVILEGAGAPHASRLHGYTDVFDCRYLYFINLDVVTDPGYGGGGNAIHLASCDHVLIRGCKLDGWDGTQRQCQETLKANQTQHLYVEDCEIKSAFWYPLDFMVVQYGHIVNCKIHDAGEWCCLIKGGSAYLHVEGNEIYHGNVGGFVAGNGAGFNYMTSPWIHYDAYDIKFVNNVIHHTRIAGMGVNGGYNILLAHNTLYRCGTNDHLIEVLHADHTCDENPALCTNILAQGGWGTMGTGSWYVPSRNVYIFNNLIYNPPGSFTGWQHFNIDAAVTPPADSNVPSPSRADDNLRIRGNLIWSGAGATPLGIEGGGGCQPGNTNCNEVQLLLENAINTIQPQLRNPEAGDYRPVPAGNVFTSLVFAIPAFPGGDRAQPPLAPVGTLSNAVPREKNGSLRYAACPPGAFTGGASFDWKGIEGANATARLVLGAETGHHYVVEASSNLVAWTTLAETNAAAATNVFIVPATQTIRALRARLLP